MHSVENGEGHGQVDHDDPGLEAKDDFLQAVVVLGPAAEGGRDPQLQEKETILGTAEETPAHPGPLGREPEAHVSQGCAASHQGCAVPNVPSFPESWGLAPASPSLRDAWLPYAEPYLPPSPETPPLPGSPPGYNQSGQELPLCSQSPQCSPTAETTYTYLHWCSETSATRVWAVSSVVSSLACPWLREAAQALLASPWSGGGAPALEQTRVHATHATSRLQLL